MRSNEGVAKVHELVNKEIEAQGLKKRYVAEKAGISEDVFYNLLQGKRKFDEDELLAVCAVLKRPPGRFLRLDRWKGATA